MYQQIIKFLGVRLMLLYLSSNENVGIFDFLSKESGMVVKKLSGEFYFKKFIIHDMRNLSHYSYFAIDLKALKDDENEIIEAVIALKTMYDSRIIVFAEGHNKEDEIINKLLEEKIYNIILAKEVYEIKEEIIKCISEVGKTKEEWISQEEKNFSLKEVTKNKYVFKHKNIKIAVVGVSSKVGTTTTAFNMANFLSEIGSKVSYTEANNNEHLKQIAAYYKFQKVENYYKYKEVEYYPNKQFPEDYNFNVFDLGILNASSIAVFRSCDIKVLCSGSKPYELIDMEKIKELVEDVKLGILFNSAADADKLFIRKNYEKEINRLYFQEYSPNLFDGNVNEKNYLEIVQDYVIRI
jgi:hypothetical protein